MNDSLKCTSYVYGGRLCGHCAVHGGYDCRREHGGE